MNEEPELCIGYGEPVEMKGGKRHCNNPDCDIYYYRRQDRGKGEAYDVRRAASLRTPPTKIILGKSPSEVVGTTEVREDGI